MDAEFTKIKFPQFVGRSVQLNKIRQFVERPGTVVINVAGSGGVGKTAILREICREFGKDAHKLVTEIIDFSHTVHRVESWILEQISEVNPEGFKAFQVMQKEVEKAGDPLSRLQRENEARAVFIHDYNALASQRRFILLFDTLELVQETQLVEFILTLVEELENTVLVLAGRNNDEAEFLLALKKAFKSKNVYSFRLQGFNDAESHEYFAQADIPYAKTINEDLRQNISLLSDGNPIKIALSLDWLDRGVKEMVELTQMPASELAGKSAKEIEEDKVKFEYAIMNGVRSLQKPINEVILYMAHFNKRFNRDLVAFFFPDEDPDQLVASLEQLPFVKFSSVNYFVIHDEMARMVQRYVWDTIEDPDKTLRRKLSEEICQYYQRELDRLKPSTECSEQEKIMRLSLEIESVYYKLYADLYSGYKEFEILYESLVNDHRSGLAGLAVNFLREFASHPNFSELLKCFVDGYYSGGVLISEQKFEEAEKKLVPAKKRLDAIWADLALDKNSPLDQYLRDRQYIIDQQLGFCYRSIGNWERAKKYFQLSLESVLGLLKRFETGELSPIAGKKVELIRQVAETLNSLANVHRLVGDYYDARLLCQTGTLLRKAWKLDTVMSQYVMAMTYWEMGATAEAVTCLRNAESEGFDENKLAMIKKYRAYILFRAGFHDQALSLLKEAEATFRQIENLSELVDSLNIRCRLYRDIYSQEMSGNSDNHNYWEEAKLLGQEACQLSLRIGDKFRQAESYLTQAILYYQWSKTKSNQAGTYRKRSLEYWEAGSKLVKDRYYQLGSLYNQLRADIAFDEKNYDLAFQYYLEQCKISTHFKHAAYERSIDHVGDKLRLLGTENSSIARQHIDKIIFAWQKEPTYPSLFPGLIDELQEVKKAILENEKIQEMEAQQEQAMLDGRWDETIEYLDKTLGIQSLYQDARSAALILIKSRAAHHEENLSEARRLAKAVLQVGKELKDERLIGNASLVLTLIFWDATSTAEAAAHLRNAKSIFQHLNDEVGLAKVKRYFNYFKYRTGVFDNLLDDLESASTIFEQHSLLGEVSDVKNIMSRIARTNPTPDFANARKFAQTAMEKALVSKDNYRIAECYISLAILAQREQRYAEVIEFYNQGMVKLPAKAHSMRTVYEGIRGSALFEQGLRAVSQPERQGLLDQAFEAYGQELIESSQAKPASLARTTGLIFEALMNLPTETDVSRYTKRIEKQVARAAQDTPWINNLQIVLKLCDYARQYYPYIHSNTG
jgi:hypothetical protein